jgi:predicted PurR-regulated permease PerM
MSTTPPPIITRPHLFAVAFFGVFILLLYQTARLLGPFSGALLWSAVLALALYPLYRKVLSLLRGRANAAALVMTVVTLLAVIGPMVALLFVLATQAVGLYQRISEGIASGSAAALMSKYAAAISEKISALPLLEGFDLKSMFMKGLTQVSSSLASDLGSLLRNTALLAVNLTIMLIALFFFFRNGEQYYRSAMELLPFTHAQKQSIAQKFYDTFTAVINGVFLIAVGQGVMTGIGFALFRIPFSVFWGFLAAVLALLPVGGSALIWVPGAVFLLVTGATTKGVLLGIWGTVLVSLPDNFLKPLLIGRKAKLPAFFLFLGILGGLQVYGFLGILFGPLVVTLITAFIQIYREEYVERTTA